MNPKHVNRTIRRGSKGPDVKQAQRALNREVRAGTVPGRKATIKADGVWGQASVRLALQVCWFLGLPLHVRKKLQRNGYFGKSAQRKLRNPGKRTAAMRSRRRRRLKARKANAGRLTPHFHVDEFRCRNGAAVPSYAVPALRALCRDYLEPLRAVHGPCGITSGYRPEDYNRAIGGEPNSLHRYELHRNAVAADTTFRNGSATVWGATAERKNPDGLGVYARSNFIHQDNRCRVGMARSRWWG